MVTKKKKEKKKSDEKNNKLLQSHGKKSTKNQPAEAKASGNAPNAIELSTKPLAADLISHMQYFEMAGVSLPKTETYQLVLAIQQLAQEKNLKNARFWGKISGTQSNYYVVESEHVGKHHQSQLQQTKESLPILNPFAANNLTLPPPSEDPEQGANQQSFWVSSYRKNAKKKKIVNHILIKLPKQLERNGICYRMLRLIKLFAHDKSESFSREISKKMFVQQKNFFLPTLDSLTSLQI